MTTHGLLQRSHIIIGGKMIDWKELTLTLVFAFDRVRKWGITNDLTLREELSEYLTKEELREVMALYNKYK
jgi:hypothetical protein